MSYFIAPAPMPTKPTYQVLLFLVLELLPMIIGGGD
jgi:hypothetical protein